LRIEREGQGGQWSLDRDAKKSLAAKIHLPAALGIAN
jgi:hypothetical protein